MISRELVRTHVFGHLEATYRRLVQDASPTIARRVHALAKAGRPVEEAEQMVRELIVAQLRVLKANTTRAILLGIKPAVDQ